MPKQSLINSLNAIRETASNEYKSIIPVLETDTGIETLSAPLLQYPNLMNEFINVLVQKISYSQLLSKTYNNPLKFLEGDRIPLGAIGEEIYINPAKGRKYDINDFAGLLKKYESDVKVQYMDINMDCQYPVTIIRQKLKQAFVSWEIFESFIGDITTSLYNGAYIDQYNATKNLVTNAYRSNAVNINVIENPTTKEQAEEFVRQARALFLNYQSPSTNYNAWNKVGGYGRSIISWSNPDEIVFLIRNDILAYIDVQVLAKAFNIDSTKLLGNIVGVDNFDIVDDEYNKIFDGSNILGIMCDNSWFRIKEQDMYMDDFRNANNRSMTYYLNVIKSYKYSYFANATVFATQEPDVPLTAIEVDKENITINGKENTETVTYTLTPATTTAKIQVEQDGNSSSNFSFEQKGKSIIIKALKTGSGTITIKSGNISKKISVTIENAD